MAKIRSLPIELQKVAETELGEVPARIPEDLKTLKIWIGQTPYLNARLDDQFLIQFLRGCKYSLQRAKEKIDLFFTLKSKFPNLFNVTDVHDAKFRKNFNIGYGLPLPMPVDDNGARVFFMNSGGDIGKGLIDMEDLYSVVTVMHEIMLMEDAYACLTPSFLKKIIQFFEKSMPFRIKGFHFLNTPGFFYTVLNLMIPMLSEKLKQRIVVHGANYTNFENSIPIKYLPTYIGGENGSTVELLRDFEKKFVKYESYFKENANYGTNESLRPGKPIDFESIYGLGGSFRKLDVD